MTKTEINKNLHWSVKLKEENKRLLATVEFLRLQLRIIPQSRFEKYKNVAYGDAIDYRKAVQEIDRLNRVAIGESYEIEEGDANETELSDVESKFRAEQKRKWDTFYEQKRKWSESR